MALNEARHAGEFILNEAAGHYCREAAIVLSGEGILSAGTILGKTVTSGSSASSAKAGNTGNGVFTQDGSTPVLGGAIPGRYVIECIEPTTNLGTFQVVAPDGRVIGTYVVAAAAFASEVKFTIADGATDFVAGDTFYMDVVVATEKWRSCDNTNTDGSAVARGILIGAVDATSADATGVALVRGPCEVNGNVLVYDAALDQAAEKALARQQLKDIGIIVR